MTTKKAGEDWFGNCGCLHACVSINPLWHVPAPMPDVVLHSLYLVVLCWCLVFTCKMSGGIEDALSILKKSIMKEGTLFKAAAAKGKDQMRANWKDRWFVLKKNTLSYFKAKGETKEKGAIDLRAAKVELVEESVTKKPYGMRIVEAKQVFYYLCASSADEQKSWYRLIRIAAGFPDPDEVAKVKELPIKQSLCYCTFGVLMHDGSVDGLNSERTAVILDPQERMVRFIQQDKIFKQHECMCCPVLCCVRHAGRWVGVWFGWDMRLIDWVWCDVLMC